MNYSNEYATRYTSIQIQVGNNTSTVTCHNKFQSLSTNLNVSRLNDKIINVYNKSKIKQMLKAVILIGGPLKGTRFRPLSLDIPKPLFPIAGQPIIEHHIEICCQISNLNEILLIGFYSHTNEIEQFVLESQRKHHINIKYLQEYTGLGTAGGIYHFRDEIRDGNPVGFFVINGDVCGNFPINDMVNVHINTTRLATVLTTETTRTESVNYGCLVMNRLTMEVTHYVEKPSVYVSQMINCGCYLFSLDIFHAIGEAWRSKEPRIGRVDLEKQVLTRLAGTGKLYAYTTSDWWSQLKTAGSAIYANRHYLELYRKKYLERLTINGTFMVINDVYVDHTAIVHPTAILGPNVSVGPGVRLGAGVRVRDSIILDDVRIDDHCLILYSIIGKKSQIGKWARIEGTPSDPDPNKPFAKIVNLPLFNLDGKLNPSITILGSSVSVSAETILLNCIVLPNKDLTRSIKNEIIL